MNRPVSRRSVLSGAARAGLILGTGTLAAACGQGGTASKAGPPIKAKIDGDLSIFNWAQYMNPDVIKGFEKTYGVKVHQTFFDNDEAMLAKLAAGVPFDFVVPSGGNYIPRLAAANLLTPIPHAELKNFGQVLPFFHNPFYDRGARYSLPYAAGTTGIAWRTDKVGGMTGSWNDLWNHPKAKGKIFLLDELADTLGMSLIRLGYNINSTAPDQVNAAADALLKLKPMLAGFSTNDITNLDGGQAWIEHAWSGDVYVALTSAKNPHLYQYQTCEEGVPTWADTMAIPRNAQHPGTALKFIDYLLDPEVSAMNATWVGYPSGTTAGTAAFNKLVKDFPWLQITESMLDTGEWSKPLLGAGLTLWDEAWTKVKAG
ncbi:MAG TPA: spermidine/putrescine ABC transporter substrate-binding protein [Streptosporangiaceae bacterium]|nr:spermidine/putrescine ABC transporter substrate-binding protein [Streptosporangiaceae bacterium]